MGAWTGRFTFDIAADLWVPEKSRQAIGAVSRTVRRVRHEEIIPQSTPESGDSQGTSAKKRLICRFWVLPAVKALA